MTTDLLTGNIVAYGAQVLAVVAAATLVLLLVRPHAARLRLAVWQGVLLLCVLLPVAQPWRTTDDTGPSFATVVSTPVVLSSEGRPGEFSIDWPAAVLSLLALGAAGRLLWLAVGLYRLRRYRLQAELIELAHPVAEFGKFVHATAGFYSSNDIRSPVTFGFLRPVVLLPSRFGELATDVQRAVICHELLHVQRRDWLFTIAEEFVRAVLWFHPAIWWLIGQIQLTREQVVDREVLDWTGSREPYMEGLLAISGAGAQLDLAPASLFLKKRHLNQRVEALLQERTMSKQRIVVCLTLLAAAVVGATWIGVGTFPLTAAPRPQGVVSRPQIEIPGEDQLLHRAAPIYPSIARDKRIEGDVSLEVSIDENGSVYDARVISGPPELRAAALQAVLAWHYSDKVVRPSTQVVTMNFRLPPERETALPPQLANLEFGIVKNIEVDGLGDARHGALLANLPVKTGEMLTRDRFLAVQSYIQGFDEHLRMSFNNVPGETDPKELNVRIFLPPGHRVPGEPIPAKAIRVGGAVQAARLIQEVPPVYPPLARQARVQGSVVLQVRIDEAGSVDKVDVVSGPALLAPAALEAVKQWRYEVTRLNGEAVTVHTQVEVHFALPE